MDDSGRTTKVYYLLFALLVLPFFKTSYIDHYEIPDLIFNIARVMASIAILVLTALAKRRIDKQTILLLVLFAWLLLMTAINEGPILDVVQYYGFGLCAFLLIGLFSKKPGIIIDVLFVLGEILVYTNLITQILFPDGLYVSKLLHNYHNWILGFKNQFLPFYLCFGVAAGLKIASGSKTVRPVALIVCMAVSMFLGKSASGIISFFIFLAIFAIVGFKRKIRINPAILFAITVIAFVLLVIVSDNEILLGTVASFSNKDATFTGRTSIWATAMTLIAARPLVGWGVMTDEAHIQLMGIPDAGSTHDYYLELMLSGGVVSIGLYIAFFVLMIVMLNKKKSSFAAQILAAALFALTIAFIVESFVNPVIFLLYGLACNVDSFVSPERQEGDLMRYLKGIKGHFVARKKSRSKS